MGPVLSGFCEPTRWAPFVSLVCKWGDWALGRLEDMPGAQGLYLGWGWTQASLNSEIPSKCALPITIFPTFWPFDGTFTSKNNSLFLPEQAILKDLKLKSAFSRWRGKLGWTLHPSCIPAGWQGGGSLASCEGGSPGLRLHSDVSPLNFYYF